jgi:hypothetical protein
MMSSSETVRRLLKRRKQASAPVSGRLAVYLSCPVTEFHSERYGAMRSLALTHFPDAELQEPRTLFRSRKDWILRWPELLNSIHAVVFFADPAGWIGRGVALEIDDAQALNVPVWYLTPHRLLPLAQVGFGPPNHADWSDYQQVAALDEE